MNKLSIFEMKSLAERHGGKCLSQKYINANSNLKWQCSKGHIWKARPGSINFGSWCPYCSKRFPLTSMEMIRIANSRGGKCLSKKYINVETKLKWQCAKGHIWEATPHHVKNGSWCSVCSGNIPLTLEKMKMVAKLHGGKCLSKKYINNTTKLKWQCANGHFWVARPMNIMRHQWCSICSSSIGEKITRKLFEHIFEKNFNKVKPEWLKNSRGNKMEIDGYCEKYKVGFEYQGQQHFKEVSYFNHSNNMLNQRINDDALKKKLCLEHGINLIIIPYTIPFNKLYDYIIYECKKNKISIPNIQKISIEGLNFSNDSYLNEAKKIAKSNNGLCLSKVYINNKTKLKWQCSKGHIWEAVSYSVKSGSWCPHCSGRAPLDIKKIQELAISRGGKCLSKIYINNSIKLKWQCAKGHTWEAQYGNVKHRSSWCPLC